MKILLAGGGSGGPVQPVLAVALEIKKKYANTEFLFVGTRKGPEREMVEAAGVSFVSIPAARWRRFFSIKNLFAPFIFLLGLFRARSVVKNFKPDVFFSAGGFVAVPLAWMARLAGVRIVIHQQDATIGLANKLIAPFADQITTAFEKTSKEFYSGSGLFNKKWETATWVGNPVRTDLLESKVDAKTYFGLHDELPILLVLGGATGAQQINRLIEEILPYLVGSHQVVHQTGKGKNTIQYKHRNYHPYELIPFDAYSAILKTAHLVIARAGLSTITELSAMGKAAILIPMPHTHQEENAKILLEKHSAVVLMREEVTAENLQKIINSLKFNQKRDEMMMKNISKLMPKDATEKLAKIILHE
jgi:UDP-N-acetylglucosamine--N-acetylmuramyl-(pentapeptide) pyrophosphoryl-undecaprenol N-acetylglucosamine transferase